MSEHTKGTWRIGDAGHTVFGPKTDNPSPETIASGLSKANAKFIVRACNSHADLLEACKKLVKDFDPHGEYYENIYIQGKKAIAKATE